MEQATMFDPKTLKTLIIDSKNYLVSPVIYDSLQRAEKKFYSTTGRHIQINSAYRSTGKQAELYKKLKAKNPAARVSKPGYSFHEKGQAIDVENWKETEPFLRKEGFQNPLKNDKIHFSIGEWKLPKIPAANVVAAILCSSAIIYLLYKYTTKGNFYHGNKKKRTRAGRRRNDRF